MKDAKGHGSDGRGGGQRRLPSVSQVPLGKLAGEEGVQDTMGRIGAHGIAQQHGIPTDHLSAGGRFGYNPEAVNNAIASSNRAGRRIGGREAKLIHRLLKGR